MCTDFLFQAFSAFVCGGGDGGNFFEFSNNCESSIHRLKITVYSISLGRHLDLFIKLITIFVKKIVNIVGNVLIYNNLASMNMMQYSSQS